MSFPTKTSSLSEKRTLLKSVNIGVIYKKEKENEKCREYVIVELV
jgi:hypothetical protein